MKLENQSKAEIRKQLLFTRKHIVKKYEKDRQIVSTLIELDEFKSCKLILAYMALDDEVNIDSMIEYAVLSHKSIAVPFCVDKNGTMDFYYINSLDDLVLGSFGIREPDVQKCKKVTDFSDSILLVPAISFDTNGYRLGYGKGYYDRFMQNYSHKSIGLCYNSLIRNELPINKYDESVDYIITDTKIYSINNGG